MRPLTGGRIFDLLRDAYRAAQVVDRRSVEIRAAVGGMLKVVQNGSQTSYT